MKVYLILRNNEALYASVDKVDAYNWAENKFGSRADGICVDGVAIQSILFAESPPSTADGTSE